jgi:hypothetical protein
MNDIGRSCCKLCSSSFVRSSLVEKHLKQLHVAKLAQAPEQVINIFVFEKYSLSFFERRMMERRQYQIDVLILPSVRAAG